MSDRITCPSCGQSYAVRPEQWAQYQGRTINCTKCGNPFVVTAPATAMPPTPPQVQPTTAQPPPVQPAAIQSASVPMQPVMPGMGTPPQAPFGAPPPPGVGMMTPGAYPAGYGMYAPPQPLQSNGPAVLSLIFGIVGFCVPAIGAIVAIIAGIMGISRTKNPKVGGRGMAIAGLVLGVVGLVIVTPLEIAFFAGVGGVMVPALSRTRDAANEIKCRNNLSQLSIAMQQYANANGGKFPDQLADLVQYGAPGNAFVCPTDDKQPPSGSPQAMASQISGGQTSYTYVGNGVTTAAPSDTIVLYEPLGNHKHGMNVLFSDGHTQFLNKAEAQTILDQQAAGKHPITLSGSTTPEP